MLQTSLNITSFTSSATTSRMNGVIIICSFGRTTNNSIAHNVGYLNRNRLNEF